MNQPNREYTNSVFKYIFSEEIAALDLYNAWSGNHYTINEGLRFMTLENALFMGQLNDVSFTLADRLIILMEHQSTLSANMPIRDLMYIARIYEMLIDRQAIYRSKLFTLPEPEFYTLYNGVEDFPDEMTFKLSDAFRRANFHGTERQPMLELVVRTFNINIGHNPQILEKCEVLRNYAVFVGRVRDLKRRGQDLSDAIASAIKYCVSHGILAEYFKNPRIGGTQYAFYRMEIGRCTD